MHFNLKLLLKDPVQLNRKSPHCDVTAMLKYFSCNKVQLLKKKE